MFSENEFRLAAISNPMFKLSWLDNEEDMRRAKVLLSFEYQRLCGGSLPESDSSDETSDGTSSSRSCTSPEKRKKKDYFSSIIKKREKSKNEDEVENYLKDTRHNLEQISDYPTIEKIFKRQRDTCIFRVGRKIVQSRRFNFHTKTFKINRQTF